MKFETVSKEKPFEGYKRDKLEKIRQGMKKEIRTDIRDDPYPEIVNKTIKENMTKTAVQESMKNLDEKLTIEDSFNCPFCTNTYLGIDGLSVHIEKIHIEPRPQFSKKYDNQMLIPHLTTKLPNQGTQETCEIINSANKSSTKTFNKTLSIEDHPIKQELVSISEQPHVRDENDGIKKHEKETAIKPKLDIKEEFVIKQELNIKEEIDIKQELEIKKRVGFIPGAEVEQEIEIESLNKQKNNKKSSDVSYPASKGSLDDLSEEFEVEYLPNDGFSAEDQIALDIVLNLQTGSDNPVSKFQSNTFDGKDHENLIEQSTTALCKEDSNSLEQTMTNKFKEQYTHQINMKECQFVNTSAEPLYWVENQEYLQASKIVAEQTKKCEQTVSYTTKLEQTNEVVKNLIINVCHQSFSHIINSNKILCMICLPQRDIKIPQEQWAQHNTDKFHQKKKEMFFKPVQLPASNKLINPQINMHDKISQYPQHYIERQMQLKVVEPWLLQYIQPKIEHIYTRTHCRALVPVILPISKANGDFEIETLVKCTICNLNIQFTKNFENIWTSHKNSDYHVIESQNYKASNGVNSAINIEDYANILEFQRAVKFKHSSNLQQTTITKQTSVDVKQCDRNNELLDMEIESDTTEELGTFLNPKETHHPLIPQRTAFPQSSTVPQSSTIPQRSRIPQNFVSSFHVPQSGYQPNMCIPGTSYNQYQVPSTSHNPNQFENVQSKSQPQ